VQATADGGRTWGRIAITLTQPARSAVSLAYTSPTTAWMALDGRLWASTNGGATWAPSTPAAAITGVTLTKWVDAQHGWLAKPGALYATTDSGAHWTAVPLGTAFQAGDQVSSLAFESSQIGIVGVTRSTSTHLLRTADGGKTWVEKTSMPVLGNVMHAGAKDFWFSGSSLLHSTDEGATWKSATKPGTSATLQVFAGPGATLYAFDDAGVVFTSVDAGTTWTALPMSPDIEIGAGFASDPLTVWTVTQDGVVLATATAAK